MHKTALEYCYSVYAKRNSAEFAQPLTNVVHNNMSDSYEGLPAASWDIFGGNKPELDFWFLKEKLKPITGPCLDLACGSGKHLVPYLKEGILIHGVDSSPTMLENCRKRLAEVNLTTELYCQKMQDLNLPGKYKAIFISVGSIAVLTSFEDAMATLRKCHAHLQAGGVFFVTLFMPVEARDKNYKAAQKLGPVPLDADHTIEIERWTEKVDYLEQTVVQKRRYTVRMGGQTTKTEEYLSSMKWYGRQEFLLMLEKAGFEGLESYGNFSDAPPTDWEQMIVVKGEKRNL